jgi:subtilisin family serine protease
MHGDRAGMFAVVSIVCSLFGCRDALDPVNSRSVSLKPSVASISQLAESRFLLVFDQDGAPSDLGGRVSALGGIVDTRLESIGLAVVTGLTPAGAQELKSVPGIIAVEPDLILSASADPEDLAIDPGESDAMAVAVQSAAAPTDALFYARQWNLRAIHADAAWSVGLLGDPDVRVAILDTGIDYLNDDLAGHVDLNRSTSLLSLSQNCTGTEPGHLTSSEDDTVRARFPGRELFSDLHSHGTAVAALIASNGRLLAGVTQRTTLFSVKVHDRFRTNCISVYLTGIVYAADHDADVIHLSIPLEFSKDSFPGLVAAVNRATSYAHRKGAVMVAAAGNDMADFDHDGTRFKFCSAVHVICVSATAPTSAAGLEGPWQNVDAIAPYTAFGRSTITVAGPGGVGNMGTATTVWLVCSGTTRVGGNPGPCRTGSRIWSSTGTSFGAAVTSGLAALLVSKMGKGQPDRIQAAIEHSADDLGDPGVDPYYGRGRINIARALGVIP